MSPTATCAVCGRTILDGERVHAYVSVQGSHDVCSLCAPRAEAAGWLPADQVDSPALPLPPRRSLLDRVLGRGKDEEGGAEKPFAAPPEPEPEPPAPAAESDLAEQPHSPSEPSESPPAEPKRRVFGRRRAEPEPPKPVADPQPAPRPDPAGPGMRGRSRPLDDAAADASPVSRFERAILRFNISEAGRTVAGLTRTLGAPSVSIGASATGAQDVRITVAWEISWYQWGVDLGDELRPVFEIAKGYEISELDASSRQWNATAVEGGHVVMGAPERGAEPDGAVRR